MKLFKIGHTSHSSALLSILFICFLSLFTLQKSYSQNENSQWYFGYAAGIDFMTSPPSLLTNGKTHTPEGAASISDSTGHLLFYTSSDTIWNKAHQVMANGTGLFGDQSSTQAALIVKQPGSNSIFFVFTTDSGVSIKGLRYSIVDMSLAAGMGSVTTKNTLLYAPCAEKLTGSMHCNGTDVWIISRGYNTPLFKSYLLTASGLSSSPVISSIGTSNAFNPGQMKVSPSGKKLAMAFYFSSPVQLFDFDNTTGLISNSLNLVPLNNLNTYGLEFSPDGTKLYATGSPFSNSFDRIVQWDLCAGNSQAIVNSQQIIFSSVAANPPDLFGSMQLAPDGKIYVARGNNIPISNQNNKFLGAINNPNASGLACSYTDVSISLAPYISFLSLPNMIYKRPQLPPFTLLSNSSSCTTVSFTAPSSLLFSAPLSCSSLGYSLSALLWNFGDPASSSANTSTLSNPVHIYSAHGIYTPSLSLFYSCGGGTQIISQTLSIEAPPILSLSDRTICLHESVQLVVSGANSYTWSTSSNSPSLIVSPSVTSSYTVSGENPPNLCISSKVVTVTVTECLDLKSEDLLKDQLKIYPNPAGNFINIESPVEAKIIIHSILGPKILEKIIQKGLNRIQIDNLENGVYLIKYYSDRWESSFRFTKTNQD